MIQVYQFFNKPVPNSSIIVPMARKRLPCEFVSTIVHQMLKKMPQKTLRDQTTRKTTALYMAVKEKYHEQTEAHLCNSQFGPRRKKADHTIAILLELNIIFAIPMNFHHLGPNRSPIATSVQNTPPQEKSHSCLMGNDRKITVKAVHGPCEQRKAKHGHTSRGKLCPSACVTFNTTGVCPSFNSMGN